MRHISLGIALVVSVGLGACANAEGSADTSSTTQGLLDQAPQSTPAGGGQAIDVATLGFDMGSKDAKVRVVEMSDYGCGYCRRFHMDTFGTLFDEFIETGDIEWKFMPYITGMFENSPMATEAAECTLEQSTEVFSVLNERLWTDQSEWKQSSDPAPVVRAMAEEAGADMDTFDECLASDRRIERIAAATALARQLGVRGTPTFFVVGYQPIQGALPTEMFRDLLTAAVAEANAAGGSE